MIEVLNKIWYIKAIRSVEMIGKIKNHITETDASAID